MVYHDRCVRCNTHTGSVCETVISWDQTLSCMGPVFTLPDKSLHVAVYDYTCICLAPSVGSYACVGRCVHCTTATDGCMSLHVTDLSQLEGMPHLRPAAQGVPLSTIGVLSSLTPHPTRYTITAPTRNGHVYIALSPSLDVIGVSSINLSGEVEESLTLPPDQPLMDTVDGCGVCVEGVVWACICGQLCGINPITQCLMQVPLSLCSHAVSFSATSLILDTPTDAEGMVLRDAALSMVRLRRIHLDKADMSCATITSLDITRSTTCGITLTGVDLSRCCGVTRETLSTAADISGVCLSGMDMGGWDMTDVSLQGVVLAGIKGTRTWLCGVDLSGQDFTGTIFRRVDITGCDMNNCVLDNASFSGVIGLTVTHLRAAASLSGVSLAGIDISRCILSGLDLRDSDLTKCTFTNTNLKGCNLCNAVLTGARGLTKTQLQSLEGKTLAGLDLRCVKDMTGVDLTGYDLSQANLSGCNLSGANLSHCLMNETVLSGTDLTDANMHGVTGLGKTGTAGCLRGVNLSGVSLVYQDLRGCDLTCANLTGCDLSGADFTDAVLTKACLRDTKRTGTIGVSGIAVIPLYSDADPVSFTTSSGERLQSVDIHPEGEAQWTAVFLYIPSEPCAWTFHTYRPVRVHFNCTTTTEIVVFSKGYIKCKRANGFLEFRRKKKENWVPVRVPVGGGLVIYKFLAESVSEYYYAAETGRLTIVN
ncbi:hypothetical protein KIPB_002482 [Kipferlia bialata]|uniref:Uncharacterized protein n=1 Tax=Kipferlia bialata TaxID=797122 RepID=A0A391NUV9_9EUKA|nr:hypothetical protein KIPB_002482 [Kipferlia bialata]|eukprot:g2482.t1